MNMKNSGGGLLILLGVVLYLIIKIGIYIIIAAVVIGFIWLIVVLTKSDTQNNVLPTTNSPERPAIINRYSCESENDYQFRILNSFINQLLKTCPDINTLNSVGRIKKSRESFYRLKISNIMLFDYIISKIEDVIKATKETKHKNRIISECRTAIYIINQLKIGQPNEAIIESIPTKNALQLIDKTQRSDISKAILIPNSENIETSQLIDIHEQELQILNAFSEKLLSSKSELYYVKIINRMKRYQESFHCSTWSKEDLYAHITGITNNTIRISRHSIDRGNVIKECEAINYLIEQLKNDTSFADIIEGLKQETAKNEDTPDQNNCIKPIELAEDISSINVPYWSHFYVYSADDISLANDQQKFFYAFFKSEFLKGRSIDIGDNSNYAFVLMFDLVEEYKKHDDLGKIQEQLAILGANYPITARYTKQALNRALSSESSPNSTLSVKISISDILSRINNEPRQPEEELVQKCKWITNGKEIEVHGFRLKRGNFYIGEKFLLPEHHRGYWSSGSPYLLASVLNKDLPVSSEETPISTFSSYTIMTPYLRYQYLKWLTGEVSIEEVSFDVLFLYLHGLEIRMFVDEDTTDYQRSDILKSVIKFKTPTIERAGIYEYGIKSFFNEFIDCAITKYFPSTPLEYVSETELYEYRTYKKYILEQAIGDRWSISCDFAYSLAISTFNFSDIVHRKYNDQLKNRFEYYFKLQHPIGLRILRNDGVLRHSYSIMNRNNSNKSFEPEQRYISCEIYETKLNYWEISNAIRDTYCNIQREFSSYNKFIEDYEGKETLSALFALPNYIDIHSDEKVIAFKTYLENILADNDYSIFDVNDVLSQWEYLRKEEKSLPKKYVDAIIGSLHILGYGIAPDYNIDKKRFNFNDQCVIYRNVEQAKVDMNNTYARMEVLVKMAAQILYSNDKTVETRNYINKYISSQNDSDINQKQLLAYFEWSLLNKQKFDSKLKDVIPLLFNEHQRVEICDVLVGLCCEGDNINSKRVDVVKKILPLFGIDNSDIHSRIHRIFTGEIDNFVTIEKRSDATEFAIPKKGDIKPKFHIDTNKLSKIEQDTRESQKVLSEIFDSEETSITQNLPQKLSAELEVLNILFTRNSWDRNEVENICRENNLMLGSLLEKLNDYAYSKVSDAVIDDGGDVIYVTTEYKEQLI